MTENQISPSESDTKPSHRGDRIPNNYRGAKRTAVLLAAALAVGGFAKTEHDAGEAHDRATSAQAQAQLQQEQDQGQLDYLREQLDTLQRSQEADQTLAALKQGLDGGNIETAIVFKGTVQFADGNGGLGGPIPDPILLNSGLKRSIQDGDYLGLQVLHSNGSVTLTKQLVDMNTAVFTPDWQGDPSVSPDPSPSLIPPLNLGPDTEAISFNTGQNTAGRLPNDLRMYAQVTLAELTLKGGPGQSDWAIYEVDPSTSVPLVDPTSTFGGYLMPGYGFGK